MTIVEESWRRRPQDSITPRDVQGPMLEISRCGDTTANRSLASVRACFEVACRQGLHVASKL